MNSLPKFKEDKEEEDEVEPQWKVEEKEDIRR